MVAFGSADRGLRASWPVRCVSTARTSRPSGGASRERKRERDPTSESAASPAGLDHWPQAPRLGATALRSPSGSGMKSCPQGQLDHQHYSHSGPGTNAILAGDEGVAGRRPNRCSRRASPAQWRAHFAPGTPRTLCLTARVAQPQTVVRMPLTSAEAIRGSLAMVDYAAGAVCMMCRPPAGGYVRPARRETLGRIRPHEAASRQRPAVTERDGTARGHRSGHGPERGTRPRFGGDRDSPAAQRPRSFPVGGFDSRRAPRPEPGWVPACTSGSSSRTSSPRPVAPGTCLIEAPGARMTTALT